MVKTRFNLTDDKEASEILEAFYNKYHKKFIGLFLVTYISDGKLMSEVISSTSDNSKYSKQNCVSNVILVEFEKPNQFFQS